MSGEDRKCLPLSPWDELPAPRRELDGIERIFMTLNAIRQNPGPFAQPLLDLAQPMLDLEETGGRSGASETGKSQDSGQETLDDMHQADLEKAEVRRGPLGPEIHDSVHPEGLPQAAEDKPKESNRRRRAAQKAVRPDPGPFEQRLPDLAQSIVGLETPGRQSRLPGTEANQESNQEATAGMLQPGKEARQSLPGTKDVENPALGDLFQATTSHVQASVRRRRDTSSDEYAENAVETGPEPSRNLSSMLCYPDQVTCADGLGVCLTGVCHCINDYILRDGRCQPELLPLGSFCDPEKASPTCAPAAQCQDHICVCKRGQRCDEDGQSRKRETVKASTVGVKHSGEPCRPGDICLNGTSCVNGVCLCPSGYRFEVSSGKFLSSSGSKPRQEL